ncbi:MAG TPA: putative zinc-binding metallopeptidase [Steroidobacteraceae bacterium]|nr:putative zinc-binding metallopeptidase [Steroidobacteraceae bacterium]
MPGRRETHARAWARLPDAELLQLRFCDLDLKLAGTPLARRLGHVYRELARRGIAFRPHMWLSEEWFSPDGVPGIAVPFYLAHPRLMQLERHMMREVEGGNGKWMMRILRHEVGHAIDTAYRLRRRARWREVFGPASLPYPESYRARPGSRSFVRHLGEWYAQSHPTEDFAETFAVWLKPNSDWRRTYASWPAWEKLRLVDEMMAEVAGRPAAVRSRAFVEPLSSNRRTLAQHYREKIARRREWHSEAIDGMLLRVFAKRPARRGVMRAAAFLRAHRRELLAGGALYGGLDQYTLQHALRLAVEGSDNMQLYLRGSQRHAVPHARWLLARLVRLLDERERPRLNL